ncbi:MAG: hypothetical protein ACPKPY_13205 [Nitrososphaeraceae archaeon]
MYRENELGKDVLIEITEKIVPDGYDGSRRCVTTSNNDLDAKKDENLIINKNDSTLKNDNFIKENNETHTGNPSDP